MQRIRLWPAIICALVAIALLFAIGFMYQKHNQENQQSPDNHQTQQTSKNHPSQQPSKDHHSKKQPEKHKTLWGVDTASAGNDSLYQCVTDHYGKPQIWGRYMRSKENISSGLTKDEASFIHQKDGHILLIFNHFSDATGHDNGVSEAKMAISFAKDLDVPKGKALFADIEPTYPIDADFIRGWVKTLSSSSYKAGIYGDFSKNSHLRDAYLSAVKKLDHKPILWSDQPRIGITSKQKAPDFNPAAPDSSKMLAWQYGIDAHKCNIDTDLARSKISQYLW